MGRSLESSRPMLLASSTASNRTSQRYSTFSNSPSLALSEGTVTTTASSSSCDPRLAEIKKLRLGFDRLESKPLQKQRFVPSQDKSDNLSKLALGAKLERALNRRMTTQDAVFKPKITNEKTAQA